MNCICHRWNGAAACRWQGSKVKSARGNPRSFCSQSSQHVCCKFEFSVSKSVKFKSPLS